MWRFAREIAQMVIAFIIFNMVSSAWDGMRYPIPQQSTSTYVPPTPPIAFRPTEIPPTPIATPTEYKPATSPAQKIRTSLGSRMVWINLYELESYNAAYKAHDSTFGIVGKSDVIFIDVGTLINVLEERSGYFKIEVLEGKYAGKQGWMDYLPAYKKPSMFRCWGTWC